MQNQMTQQEFFEVLENHQEIVLEAVSETRDLWRDQEIVLEEWVTKYKKSIFLMTLILIHYRAIVPDNTPDEEPLDSALGFLCPILCVMVFRETDFLAETMKEIQERSPELHQLLLFSIAILPKIYLE